VTPCTPQSSGVPQDNTTELYQWRETLERDTRAAPASQVSLAARSAAKSQLQCEHTCMLRLLQPTSALPYICASSTPSPHFQAPIFSPHWSIHHVLHVSITTPNTKKYTLQNLPPPSPQSLHAPPQKEEVTHAHTLTHSPPLHTPPSSSQAPSLALHSTHPGTHPSPRLWHWETPNPLN